MQPFWYALFNFTGGDVPGQNGSTRRTIKKLRRTLRGMPSRKLPGAKISIEVWAQNTIKLHQAAKRRAARS